MQEVISTKKIDFKGFKVENYQDVLTNDAKQFLLALHQKFNKSRLKLLVNRTIDQAHFDSGAFPSFSEETKKY